ncbi:MAG: hypothetical protein ACTTJ6_03390 [Treponema sp.]
MQCRYCGRELKSIAGNLTTTYSQMCDVSPTKKHVCISDGVHCVYCGRETCSIAGHLTTAYGQRCSPSPSGNHVLQ